MSAMPPVAVVMAVPAVPVEVPAPPVTAAAVVAGGTGERLPPVAGRHPVVARGDDEQRMRDARPRHVDPRPAEEGRDEPRAPVDGVLPAAVEEQVHVDPGSVADGWSGRYDDERRRRGERDHRGRRDADVDADVDVGRARRRSEPRERREGGDPGRDSHAGFHTSSAVLCEGARDRRTPVDRSRARALAKDAIARGDALGWFEALYREAEAGAAVVPWADLVPNPHLVEWLDAHPAPRGGHALDVGTGLGDNAAELARRGFDVVAFDVSPTAVARARARFPASPAAWVAADLLDPPPAGRARDRGARAPDARRAGRDAPRDRARPRAGGARGGDALAAHAGGGGGDRRRRAAPHDVRRLPRRRGPPGAPVPGDVPARRPGAVADALSAGRALTARSSAAVPSWSRDPRR